MRYRDFEALGKGLLPYLPGFVAKGPLTFASPIGLALRGLCFEGSSFDASSFYVWVFFMPLCVPSETLYFNFGKRLRRDGIDGWSGDAPDIKVALAKAVQEQAVPFFNLLDTPTKVANVLRGDVAESPTLHTRQAYAYVLARIGDTAAALEVLDQLQKSVDPSVPWQFKMKERAALLREKILEGPEATSAQLAMWETETIKNLGLEKYR